VLVLGAGPAGLTAAHELVRHGVATTVVEADAVVGGLARTEVFRGNYFDIGGHRFFTKMAEVERLWHEVLGDQLIEVPRLSRILYQGRFFYYPLRPLNAFFGLGLVNSVWVTLSYVRSRLFPRLPEETFEEYVSNRFGRRLFHIFFKTYTEKVWGIPCTEIRAEWAAQRIRNLSFSSAVKNALFGSRHGEIKSLIEKFLYPRLGPGMMWERFRERVEAGGGCVLTECPVEGLERSDGLVTGVRVRRAGCEAEVLPATHVISSLPLRDLVLSLSPSAPDDVRHAANDLRYRDFLTVVLIVRRPELFPDNWIYVHTPHVSVGRIQNFRNWSREMVADPATTTLGLEYFVSEGDELWSMPDADLVRLATHELEQLGLAAASDVTDGAVKRMKKAYPVYDSTYRENLAIVRGYLDSFTNLQTVGRNGLHKYNNQDHSMMTGLLAARNVWGGESHDLWAVNTDLEYQEEVRATPVEIGTSP
jgi:protoporphyrinogen oxidase